MNLGLRPTDLVVARGNVPATQAGKKVTYINNFTRLNRHQNQQDL